MRRQVVKEVEDHFRALPAKVPEFDHVNPYAPAPTAFLVENAGTLRITLPDLDQSEPLLKDLNALKI